MLMKLTPIVNFTNMLQTAFPYESVFEKFLFSCSLGNLLSKGNQREKLLTTC